MSAVTTQHFVGFISTMSQSISAHRDGLNQLDSALGDGDHGTGISTAFEATVETIKGLDNPNLMDVLKTTATTLMNRMGGASGALFGTFFLKGAIVAKDKKTLSKSDMGALLQAGLEGVKQRGKSDVGDKTMIDALSPAVNAFKASADFDEAWKHAATAARQGAESTKELVAKHGRAKFIGERAIGHQDAGATTIALMFEAIQDYWEEKA
jgi:phosphoenolpyruvate---glycerone phosphotransferase subunit DhaL